MSRKRKMASITSAGLVFAMLLSQSAVADLGTEQVKAAEETAKVTPEDIKLQESDFSGDFWNDGIWKVNPSTWDNTTIHCHAYTDDDVKDVVQGNESTGGNVVHYWMQDSGNLTINQSISELPKGKYTMVAYVMGEKSNISFNLGEAKSESESLTKWGEWNKISKTFEISEDESNVNAGIYVDIEAGGYGYIDHINISGETVKTDDNKSDYEDGTNKNTIESFNEDGTFENSVKIEDGYTLNSKYILSETPGTSVVKSDETSKKDERKLAYNFYSDKDISYTMTQKLKLSAGSYKLTSDVTGGDGIKVYAYLDGKVSTDSVENPGWDVWDSVGNNSVFVLDEEKEVNVGLYIVITASGWGFVDNIKITKIDDTAESGTQKIEELNKSDNETNIPAVDSDLYVDKIKGLSSDFIRGVDISSVVSEYNSGVKYYDFDGNELALTSADGKKSFFDFLKECGVNWVRVRVWNDPTTADGNSYGGGANDLATAKIIGKAATDAGLRVLVDFHYSDFWADPNMQGAPKAWKNMSLDEKVAALSSYTTNSMEELLNAGVDVGMVQIGNETNNGLAGEKPEYNSDTSKSLNLTNMGKLFNAGSKAVKAEASKYNKEILVAIHYTNVQDEGYYESVAKALQNANVDYDVFATSYYPFWHGTTSNLTSVMSSIAKRYDKKVMVAETSYAYTLDDGDGHENNVREGATGLEYNYSVSVQGQANAVADVISAVKAIGDDGIGMFYWEPAWIPVQYAYNDDGSVNSDILASNKSKWEKYGSGWASSYSYEYDPDNAGKYYGGSSWDNQAMFDQNGHPLESINVYKYVLTGTTAKAKLEEVPGCTYSVFASSDWSMPTKVQAVYTDNKKYDVDVTWNSSQVEEAKNSGVGTYKIDGTVNANDRMYKVVCTLTIQYPNLLLNNGFEDEDMSMWTITGEGVGRLADSNKRTGDYSLKFWSADPVDYTASQKVKLNKGKYDLSAYVQGGDAGENPTFQLYMKVNGKTYTADGTVSKWQIWSNPSITGIDVTEDGTEVEIGVITKAAAGAWGAWDDFYLCRTGDASSDADNGNTGDDENKKPDTPSTDDNNKDNTGSGDTTTDKDNGADKDDANKGSTIAPTTAPATQPAKALTPGAVVSSTSDTKTTVKDTKGILPDTVKFESKKVTDEKEVAKVADVVKDKIVGVKDVSIYELNLTDGTTQLHQLADKVQVTMDMPFALADNEAIKVFRVDGDKLIACTSKVIDGKLVFETDHFSTFAFVKVNANAGTKAAPASAAKTSDDSNMYMWLVIAMACLGVSIAALMNRKKEQA